MVITGFFGEFEYPRPFLQKVSNAWIYILMASLILKWAAFISMAGKKIQRVKGARMAIEHYVPDFTVEAV